MTSLSTLYTLALIGRTQYLNTQIICTGTPTPHLIISFLLCTSRPTCKSVLTIDFVC